MREMGIFQAPAKRVRPSGWGLVEGESALKGKVLAVSNVLRADADAACRVPLDAGFEFAEEFPADGCG